MHAKYLTAALDCKSRKRSPTEEMDTMDTGRRRGKAEERRRDEREVEEGCSLRFLVGRLRAWLKTELLQLPRSAPTRFSATSTSSIMLA